MARVLPTIKEMLEDGTIPICHGAWVDVYNHISNKNITGTINTRISHANYYYVTEIKDSAGN